MKFLDQAKIYIASGHGGPGSISFRREAHVPFGGPDGGNGGRGGDVIALCSNGLNTLIDFRYQQHFKARPGEGGKGRDRSGISGKDIILRLPIGTQILDETNNFILADMTEIGKKVVLAKGGEGGKGNSFFKTSVNQAPRKAQPGGPLEEKWIWLRLKLIADIGLIGLPNAGKSTLLSRITAAKPKIADYPFTTLHPNLGVVNQDNMEFVIADIPGLIEGAHQGSGLGHRFLGHVERCQGLLHLIDVTSTDIEKNYLTITNELRAYDENLSKKKQILVLTKCDAVEQKKVQFAKEILKKLNIENIVNISSVSGENIIYLIRELQNFIVKMKNKENIKEQNKKIISWSP